MTASETLDAYEGGLITEAEALEQAFVEDLDELYDKVAGGDRRREGRAQEHLTDHSPRH